MDVFKLAFETSVVGLSAFVWLGVAVYLLFPEFVTDFFSRTLPALAKDNQTLLSVAALTLAYCLGSAILPISSQLMNDEHWPLAESAIRCKVFETEQQDLEKIGYTALPNRLSLGDLGPGHCSAFAARDSVDFDRTKRILTLFAQEESKILNQTSEVTDRLKQLHERIVVLRGAVFSGCALLLICFFAYVARVNGQSTHWKRTIWGTLMAVFFTVFVLRNAYYDLRQASIFDVPVLECVLGAIIIYGGILVVRGVKTRPFRRIGTLLAVAFFAALAYGGWMSSEITYDQQVVSSSAVLQGTAETPKH